MFSQSQSKPPKRYHQNIQSYESQTHTIAYDLVDIEFTLAECISLYSLFSSADFQSTDCTIISFNLPSNVDEDKKRETEAQFNAFKKIFAAKPGSLKIVEQPIKMVVIPEETKPHLNKMRKAFESLFKNGLKGKSDQLAAQSAKPELQTETAWASIIPWPSPMTPAFEEQKKLAIEALNDICSVIPNSLKGQYKGKNLQLFPSKESLSILVGLVYLTQQLQAHEIFYRSSNELRPYLSYRRIDPSDTNKEPMSVLVIKDPHLHPKEFKEHLQNYFNKYTGFSFRVESQKPTQ